MELAFHPYGLAGLAGFVATWGMAAFLWMRGAASSVNRHLAVLLAAEGIAVITTGLDFLLVEAPDRFALGILHFMADASLPPLYLLFLSHALDMPFARAFRSHSGHAALWMLAIAGPLFVLAFDEKMLVGPTTPGPWVYGLFAYVTSGFLLGIVAAIIAYRRARTPMAKRRARAFLIAFSFFDVVWGALYGQAAAVSYGMMSDAFNEEMLLLYALATPIFVGLLSYAILKAQLFDIDVKIRIGIKRGTIALAFLLVFVAVAEIAQNFLSQEYGIAAGGIVAALLLVAIRPLERAADRVAHAAMPSATGSPEYMAYKKLEVYRAAVESAIELDGRIDERERSKLEKLAGKLGVRPEDATAVQRDALGAMAA